MPVPIGISHPDLRRVLDSADPPLLIDVRREAAFVAATDVLPGALRRNPEDPVRWASELPQASSVVVYCAHGREVSQRVAGALAERGLAACYLEGGIESGWRAHAAPLSTKPVGASSRWVTRARPKIDRLACPWLIARFIDPAAEFLYVPPESVLAVAREREATPYDVVGVPLSHVGEHCSFDAFLEAYRLRDPALGQLARIVRGADTDDLDLAPQAAGLLAISLGLARLVRDDHELLRQAMVLYDALYLWCREGQSEVHSWNPGTHR
jgi:rhodanese-related sulfurtransferase